MFPAVSICKVALHLVGQRAVGDPLLTLEQGHHRQEHGLELSLRLGTLAGRGLHGQHRSHLDQDTAVLIHRHTLALDEFVLHIVQGCVVELELPLEGAVGKPPPTLEHRDHLVKALLKGHPLPSRGRCSVLQTVREWDKSFRRMYTAHG
jgi:hypothetical protein